MAWIKAHVVGVSVALVVLGVIVIFIGLSGADRESINPGLSLEGNCVANQLDGAGCADFLANMRSRSDQGVVKYQLLAVFGVALVGGGGLLYLWHWLGTSREVDSKVPHSGNPRKKRCPACAEHVRFEATKCKHCGEALNA